MKLPYIVPAIFILSSPGYATEDAGPVGGAPIEQCAILEGDSLGSADTPSELEFRLELPEDQFPTSGALLVVFDAQTASVVERSLGFQLADEAWRPFDHFRDVCWDGDCDNLRIGAGGSFPIRTPDAWRNTPIRVRLAQFEGPPMAPLRVCIMLTMRVGRPAAADAALPVNGGGSDSGIQVDASPQRPPLPAAPARADSESCHQLPGQSGGPGLLMFAVALGILRRKGRHAHR